MGQHVVRLGDPIGLGKATDEGGEARVVPPQCRLQRFLPRGDPLGAPALLVAQAQHLFRRLKQIGEQLPLPAVPRARPHRANVDDGQHQQQAQAFGALHHLAEIEDRLEIAQVALERGRRHQQVPADQPRHRLRLGG